MLRSYVHGSEHGSTLGGPRLPTRRARRKIRQRTNECGFRIVANQNKKKIVIFSYKVMTALNEGKTRELATPTGPRSGEGRHRNQGVCVPDPTRPVTLAHAPASHSIK